MVHKVKENKGLRNSTHYKMPTLGGISYLPSRGPVLDDGEIILVSYQNILLYSSSAPEMGDVHLTSFKICWIAHREKAKEAAITSLRSPAEAYKHLMLPLRAVLYAEKDRNNYVRIRSKSGGTITTHWKVGMGLFLDALTQELHSPSIFSPSPLWPLLYAKYPDKIPHSTIVHMDARRWAQLSIWDHIDNTNHRNLPNCPCHTVQPHSAAPYVLEVCRDILAHPPRVTWASPSLAIVRSGFPSNNVFALEYYKALVSTLRGPSNSSLFVTPRILCVHLCNRTRVGCHRHVGLGMESGRDFHQWPLLSPYGLAKAYEELDSCTLHSGNSSKWTKNVWRIITLLHDLVRLVSVHRTESHGPMGLWISSWAGSDRAVVVTALLQICLDGTYRTMDGFQLLVEKEWLQGGHPFSSRLGHLTDPMGAAPGSRAHRREISPVFVLFLDILRCIVRQHPQCFEITEPYLVCLLDVMYSGTVGTFLGNSPSHRLAMKLSETPCAWAYLKGLPFHATLHINPLFDAASQTRPILLEKHVPPTLWYLFRRYWLDVISHVDSTMCVKRVLPKGPPKNPLCNIPPKNSVRDVVEVTEPIHHVEAATGDGLTLSYMDLVETPRQTRDLRDGKSRVVYFDIPRNSSHSYINSVD